MWIAAIIGIELARDNLLPMGQNATDNALLVINVLVQVSYSGFVSEFLKLRRYAPRLFVVFILTNVATIAVPTVVGLISHQPVSQEVIFIPNAVSIAVAVTIALLRRRASFVPAHTSLSASSATLRSSPAARSGT